MFELFSENPWVIIPCLALLIPILGVVFGTTTGYLTNIRRAELEAALKQDMLNRGMSAEQIKMVIEASSHKGGKSCKSEEAS